MEDEDTKEIVRARIAFLLNAIRDTLPGKKRRRLEKYERKLEARKKHVRAKRNASERPVASDRVERKKKREEQGPAA